MKVTQTPAIVCQTPVKSQTQATQQKPESSSPVTSAPAGDHFQLKDLGKSALGTAAGTAATTMAFSMEGMAAAFGPDQGFHKALEASSKLAKSNAMGITMLVAPALSGMVAAHTLADSKGGAAIAGGAAGALTGAVIMGAVFRNGAAAGYGAKFGAIGGAVAGAISK